MNAIYIHIPFCIHKCAYCDFNSYPDMDSLYPDYIEALKHEIDIYRERFTDERINSVYIGGGTPTALGKILLGSLLEYLYSSFTIDAGAEITTEANPDTVDLDLLKSLRGCGVNRISFGVQSLDDRFLNVLGRTHSAEQAVIAFKQARESGFSNISLDLMFGLPGQTIAQWMFTLEQAAVLEPEHLSCYGLSVEEGTVLKRDIDAGLLSEPDQDTQADMLLYTMESLSESGYRHYEISNYAKSGFECRHNLVYWDYGDYLGIGAGAHSKIKNVRFSNVTNPRQYIAAVRTGKQIEERAELDTSGMLSEELMLGLRKLDGVDLDALSDKYRINVGERYREQIHELEAKGLITSTKQLHLTGRGVLLGNEVFRSFI